MSFVVDGSEWRFDGLDAAGIEAALDPLIERINVARERDETVWVGESLFVREVLGGRDFWSLFGEDAPVTLPRSLLEKMTAAVALLPRYAESSDYPPGFLTHDQIGIGGQEPEENLDVSWAHHQTRRRRATACLGLTRRGEHATTSGAGAVAVWWVTDEATHRAFYRDAIDVERDCEATLERLAPHAFPDLWFVQGVWRGLSDFNGGYEAARALLRRHLTVYDDHGQAAFALGSNQAVQQRFEAEGIDVAPEKPEVFKDAIYRKARECEVGGVTLYCAWHGRLERHQNRVHIHKPVPQSDGKVVVAIFHRHLPLPGD